MRLLNAAIPYVTANWVRHTTSVAEREPLIIIFSKDRAAQLDLLLSSYARMVTNPAALTVLYRSTTPLHAAAYASVASEHRHLALRLIPEIFFSDDLINILQQNKSKRLIFLVDDIVFVRPFDCTVLSQWNPYQGVLSLRLGANITRSYNRGCIVRRPKSLSTIQKDGLDLLHWRWKDGEFDWRLALSLDGNLLPLIELRHLILKDRKRFNSPNSLEAALGRYRFIFDSQVGFCWTQSRIVNLPLNSVKAEDIDFPHAGGDTEKLRQQYDEGYRLCAGDFPIDEHDSCHMEWSPTGKSRGHEHVMP